MGRKVFRGFAHFDIGLGTPQVGVIEYDVRTIGGRDYADEYGGSLRLVGPEFHDTPWAAWAAVAEKLDAVAATLRDKAATIRAEKATVPA